MPVFFVMQGEWLVSDISSPESALISKGKHCLLSRHDYFDLNSTDFHKILKKNSRVGGASGHRFAII